MLILLSRTRDDENIWVPDGSRTHDPPHTAPVECSRSFICSYWRICCMSNKLDTEQALNVDGLPGFLLISQFSCVFPS